MTIHFDEPALAVVPKLAQDQEDLASWDLDISIVESGPAADRLIRMTDDGCGQTCQSACSTTCP
ncbi:FxLD family lanthipeptide [Frankia sp. R82]|uniref:FxLD family lanthipeptide n=1 Tax=Frankia sp. R82 TaxID=2950553 RepID=UPI002043C481|nr:FxLD family lanthipeptide [Frankia sp. R82]MCM3884299.1 FxLD family lanthipeptide [Frankia sp. R82]